MKETLFDSYNMDYVEIYCPMAKLLAYWHVHALGFTITANSDIDSGNPGISSYVLESNKVRLVLTSVYPMGNVPVNIDVSDFVGTNYCGIKRLALKVPSVTEAFNNSIEKGAIPIKYPHVLKDTDGFIEEAAIKLYDNSEIVFINRDSYIGAFKPGYKEIVPGHKQNKNYFQSVDHIASEVRINESGYWSTYLTNTIGTQLVQSIHTSKENKTGMILNVNQSFDRRLTLVIAEPENYLNKSKVQANIDNFGPGIHHLALATDDLVGTIGDLTERGVDFVSFPATYYELLRKDPTLTEMDIDLLERNGILIDKEGETYLLQKFIKPISDRPFFLYEIVQRVNGYSGFALKNINVLKKAEEIQIMKS
jgi:4-hydroxyphenylpyruvate dioxygenase